MITVSIIIGEIEEYNTYIRNINRISK